MRPRALRSGFPIGLVFRALTSPPCPLPLPRRPGPGQCGQDHPDAHAQGRAPGPAPADPVPDERGECEREHGRRGTLTRRGRVFFLSAGALARRLPRCARRWRPARGPGCARSSSPLGGHDTGAHAAEPRSGPACAAGPPRPRTQPWRRGERAGERRPMGPRAPVLSLLSLSPAHPHPFTGAPNGGHQLQGL